MRYPLQWLIASLVLIMVLAAYAHTCYLITKTNHTDFNLLYYAAKSFNQHQDPYTRRLEQGVSPSLKSTLKPTHYFVHNTTNLNTPLFIMLSSPLAKFNYTTGYYLWSSLSIVAALLSFIIIASCYQLNPLSPAGLGAMSAFLISYPSYANILYSEIGLVNLLMVTLLWLSARQGYYRMAGIILGLAIYIKLFNVIFIGLFCVLRYYRLLSWALLSFSLLLGISYYMLGADIFQHYFTTLQHIIWYSSTANSSILGNFARLFGLAAEGNQALWPLPEITQPLYYGVSSLLILCTYRFIRQARTQQPTDFDSAFGLTIALLLLISPLTWPYYQILLVLPLAYILSQPLRHPYWLIWKLIALIGLLLVNVPAFNYFPAAITPSLTLLLNAALSTFACLIIYSLLLVRHRLVRMDLPQQSTISFSYLHYGLVIGISLMPAVIAYLASLVGPHFH